MMKDSRDKVQLLTTYVNTETVILACLPIAYGVIALIYGDAIWFAGNEGVDVYETAFLVPYAPESVGGAFVFCGVLTLLFNQKKQRWGRWLAFACGVSAVVFLIFSAGFFIDIVAHEAVQAYPPFFVYLTFTFVMVNRMGLAWSWASGQKSGKQTSELEDEFKDY